MATDLEDGLVLHLPLNEGYGSVVYDKSKYQNHGAISGAIFVKPYNDMSNDSEEEGEAPVVIYDDDETLWTASVGTDVISEETTIVKKGVSSLEWIIDRTVAGDHYVKYTFAAPIDVTGKDLFSLWIYGANTGRPMQFIMGDAGGTFYRRYDWTDDYSGWRRHIFSVDRFNTEFGVWDSTDIGQARVHFDAGGAIGGTSTVYVDRITADVGNWRFGDVLNFITNDYVEVPYDASMWGLSAFTVSAWVIPNDAVSNQRIMINLRGATAGHYYALQIWNTVWWFSLDTDADSAILQNTTPVVGERAFLVGTWDGTTIKLYLNGKLLASAACAGALTSTGNITEVGIYNIASQPFDGIIDEPRMYNRALSPEEIMSLYKEKEIDLDRGLVLDLPMNEGSGEEVKDRSKHQNHGIIQGGATWVGNELDLDGVDGEVEINDSPSLDVINEVTIAIWFKITSITPDTYPRLLEKSGAIHAILFDYPSGNHINWGPYIKGTQHWVTSPISFIDGLWYLVVCTYKSGDERMYLNGILKDVNTVPIGDISVTTANLYIGTAHSSGFFNGLIKKVRMYNRVLSPEEIRALYLKGT